MSDKPAQSTIVCQDCHRTIQVTQPPKPGDKIECRCGWYVIIGQYQGKKE